MLKIVKNILAGVVIGVSNVIPGVSGGTMAVVMNIYDDLINALSIKKLKQNWLFLLTVIIGLGAGILLFSKAITFLFENYFMPTNFFFIGLIIGSIPMIYKRAAIDGIKPSGIIAFIIGLGVMIVMFVFKDVDNGQNIVRTLDAGMFAILFISAIAAAFSMVIPGISGSLIMLILGSYATVIAAVDELNIQILIPVGLGVVVGIFLALKVMKALLARAPGLTYFAILGLVVGSLISIYPGFAFDTMGLISVITLVVGTALALFFVHIDKKNA